MACAHFNRVQILPEAIVLRIGCAAISPRIQNWYLYGPISTEPGTNPYYTQHTAMRARTSKFCMNDVQLELWRQSIHDDCAVKPSSRISSSVLPITRMKFGFSLIQDQIYESGRKLWVIECQFECKKMIWYPKDLRQFKLISQNMGALGSVLTC